MIDWDADADLHVLAQMQTEPRKSPKYLKTGKLVTLVKEVMEKRPADRQAYSITVGDEDYGFNAVYVFRCRPRIYQLALLRLSIGFPQCRFGKIAPGFKYPKLPIREGADFPPLK
jgi:hypothetical protein